MMKLLFVFPLLLAQAYAQEELDRFFSRVGGSSYNNRTPSVIEDGTEVVESGVEESGCSNVASMPMNVLEKFLDDKGRIDVKYDNSAGKIIVDYGEVRAGDCFKQFVEPTLAFEKVSGKSAYTVEFKFVNGGYASLITCMEEKEKECAAVEDIAACFKEKAPSLDLTKRMDARINNGVATSAPIYMKSQGKFAAKTEEAAEEITGDSHVAFAEPCTVFQTMGDNKRYLTRTDALNQKDSEELTALCSKNNYSELNALIESWGSAYIDNIEIVEKDLLARLEKAKKEDLEEIDEEILTNFEEYVVGPLREEMLRREKEGEDYTDILDKLKSYEKYFGSDFVDKLEEAKKFDGARATSNIRLTLNSYELVGQEVINEEGGREIKGPKMVETDLKLALDDNTSLYSAKFEANLVTSKKLVGKYKTYKSLSDKFKDNATNRFNNYKSLKEAMYNELQAKITNQCYSYQMQGEQAYASCQSNLWNQYYPQLKTKFDEMDKDLIAENKLDETKYNQYKLLGEHWKGLEEKGESYLEDNDLTMDDLTVSALTMREDKVESDKTVDPDSDKYSVSYSGGATQASQTWSNLASAGTSLYQSYMLQQQQQAYNSSTTGTTTGNGLWNSTGYGYNFGVQNYGLGSSLGVTTGVPSYYGTWNPYFSTGNYFDMSSSVYRSPTGIYSW